MDFITKLILTRCCGAFALCWLLLLSATPDATAQATVSRNFAVEVSAAVQTSPASITLRWTGDALATGYTISRKPLTATSWSQIGTVGGAAKSFTDTSVAIGGTYEYRLVKTTSRGFNGYGYIYAGIQAPLVDNLGKVLLLVDNTYAGDLAAELTRLQKDLVGDGWTVVRRDVARSMSPRQVKSVIQNEWNADRTNLKSVFIFGHVAVPYAGGVAWDGHGDHSGAWPADSYYADMDGNWTGSDSRFDQSYIPSDVELQVGRVDLANMTCFANKSFSRNERDLLRQYLNKDHNFRHRVFTADRRGVLIDTFGERGGEAFAASGWRNFAPFFGGENVSELGYGSYFSHLSQNAALWSYGCGGGSFTTCDGVGGSDQFAENDIKTVFTMFLGSYFGDWNNESAFLRAPLGSTSFTLASAWAGRPHWVFHHMGLGETLGLGAKLSMNNGNGGPYQAQNLGTRGVHVSLMGDPTLRMFPVIPARNVQGVSTGAGTALTWAPSTDGDLVGYHVYRAASLNGQFTRLTTAPIGATAFTDIGGSGTYMVRAVKLERSGSGTYYNASQGAFWPDSNTLPATEMAPAAPLNLNAVADSATQVRLTWTDNANNETSYRLERKTGQNGNFTIAATLPANASAYTDNSVTPANQYFYRVAAINAGGQSSFCPEATVFTSQGPQIAAGATFVSADSSTGGNWKGTYGSQGYSIPGNATSLPGYALVTLGGAQQYVWHETPTEGRTLQREGNGRIASCLFSTSSFTIDVNLVDGLAHRVSLYVLDWDNSGRSQLVEVVSNTGVVLDSQTVSGFSAGRYLTWDLKGQVKIRLTRIGGFNAAVSGIFFDPAPEGAVATASAGLASGKFNLQIKGATGQKYKIYASSNLTTWTESLTVTLTGSSYNYTDPDASATRSRFYRAVRVP